MVVRVTFNTSNPSLSIPWHIDVIDAKSEAAAMASVAKHIAGYERPPEYLMEVVSRM
jgi:hypothetical protein